MAMHLTKVINWNKILNKDEIYQLMDELDQNGCDPDGYWTLDDNFGATDVANLVLTVPMMWEVTYGSFHHVTLDTVTQKNRVYKHGIHTMVLIDPADDSNWIATEAYDSI